MQVTLQPSVNCEYDPNGNVLNSVHAAPTDFNRWMSEHAIKRGGGPEFAPLPY
jgi:hypothetical protein